MDKRDIDKYFKDELQGYSKEVDTDAIWKSLDLEKKSRKSRFFWWPIAFALIVILSGIYFVLDRNTSHPVLVRLNQNTIDEKEASSNLMSDIAISKLPNNNTKDILAINTVEEGQISENIVDKLSAPNVATIESDSIKMRIDVNAIGHIISDPIKVNDTSSGDQFTSIKSRENNELLALDIKSETKLSKDESLHLIQTANNSKNITSSSLEIKYAQPLPVNKRALSEPLLIKKDVLNDYSNRGIRLNIYSGISYVDRSLNAHNIELNPFVLSKEKTETPLELISLGVQLRYDIGAVYLKGGIEFQWLNTKFEYEQYNIIDTVATSGVVGILIDANGNSFNQVGTVYEENSLTSQWTHYNSHRLFNLPLSIGYEKKISKWYFSIEAQSQLNFMHSFSGKRLDKEDNVTDNTSDINQSFKMGLGVAFGLRYKLSDVTSIYCSPNYFSYITSFTKRSESYSENYSLLGLQIGMSYKLN